MKNLSLVQIQGLLCVKTRLTHLDGDELFRTPNLLSKDDPLLQCTHQSMYSVLTAQREAYKNVSYSTFRIQSQQQVCIPKHWSCTCRTNHFERRKKMLDGTVHVNDVQGSLFRRCHVIENF